MNEMRSNNEDCVYPGHFVPLFNAEELSKELGQPHEGEMLNPPVNIIEMEDSYKVEIAIPGAKREDFLLSSNDHILTVAVLNREAQNSNSQFKLHEYNYRCFQRHILLPEDADTEFSAAEYCSGVLRVFLPKNKQSHLNIHSSIVVY